MQLAISIRLLLRFVMIGSLNDIQRINSLMTFERNDKYRKEGRRNKTTGLLNESNSVS